MKIEKRVNGRLFIDGMELDREVADLVRTLNKGGIMTISSCSGHGKELGHIWLKDGRVLIIFHPNYSKGEDAMKDEVVSMLRGQ